MFRIKIGIWLAIFIFFFLWLRLFSLSIVQGDKLRGLSDKNCIRLLPQEGSRGKILDIEGRVIADNALSYDAMVMPDNESSIDKTLTRIASVLGAHFKDLKERYRKGFFAQFMPVIIAENIDIKKAVALEEMKYDFNGIIIQPKPLRNYPYGRLAAHLLGYLNEIDRWRLTRLADYGYKTKDTVGFGGVEEKYDYYLRQEEGALSVEVDHKGRFMRMLGFRPPKSGKDINLTLNLKLQQIAEEAIKEKKGCVIIMEPYTGQIKAMVSSPNFDPSVFVKKADISSLNNIFNSSSAILMNRAISGAYPAASVFKLIVATAALEMGKIDLSTTFTCTGSTQVGRRNFKCWNIHGPQNLTGGIINSCDVFFYRTGLLTGAQAIHDYALKFGFAKPTAIDLPYETKGFVPSPLWRKMYKFKDWYDGDTANLSIGQGELLVTPIQLTRMMAVFANRGTLVTPYMLKAVDGQDLTAYGNKLSRIPVKESTINYVREGLRGVVAAEHGTARILAALPVEVAGKTGTAQVTLGLSHGWFLGFFPYKNPKYVICVFLEHGNSGYAATLAVKQIIETMAKEGLI